MEVHTQATQPAQLYTALNGMGRESDGNEHLAFRLGTQEYAVDIADVCEIRNYERPTRMLGAASYVPGVMSLRGTIVPIVDLRMRLGLPANFDSETVIVVMALKSGMVGVVVDGVSDVLPIEPDSIQHLEKLNDSEDTRLFQGLGSVRHMGHERTLIVMNFQGLMPRIELPTLCFKRYTK